MLIEKHSIGSRRPVVFACWLVLLTPACTLAQAVSIGTSTFHDPNIYDIYRPTADQITQAQLEVTTDWDFDQASVTASYNGALELFRDLPSRNFHAHLLSFALLYHFEDSDDESSTEDVEPDSTNADSPGGTDAPGKPSEIIRSDSTDRYLWFGVTGASQFDKDEATDFGNPGVYDNSVIEATALLRQPLGARFSFRPFYSFSDHAYPHISVISNYQNAVGVQLGSDVVGGGWIAVTPAFALKNYTGSATYDDTSTFRKTSGHGKGFGSGNGGVRVQRIVFTTPSVSQFTLTVAWKQTIFRGTEITGEYTHFAAPSGEGRIIPQQVRGGSEQQGAIGTFTSQNEIFDDHFAYTGDAATGQVSAPLPLGLTLTARQQLQNKTYSVPAMDLTDSLTLSAHRNDHRYETTLRLSRPIRLGERGNLKPEMEFHYVRNNSNAPYYDFDKSIVLFGISYEF